ncbi:putative ATP-binding cassette protein subfamily A member 10 [Leptomonas pyrrhocoris]|uniref:ATP-binding cassette protein subfamily A member 10 putativeABC transporter putative (ABCA10) n=1 Tax=Leptomonas pyrrhocoris TaxID=157538 RepID=A0A0M9G1B2_LEPPY|nr:ATP-binding cassette protein subfamily A member 10 putativeABC transporter putative (ABCA10) [Leptomonas pyrrhocoris]XP_015658800.1 ATP-binding cassette protein subfamily A member 10 putativeABC transporter putative (ABCA10) [Leptomonas pyrrhocoris]XP_015658803.1 ATP-binding cassette protein subfamily A member 10 putativeABC transporter putative (ABCA10) [Leptomonas pyrrhocoris]XP_015658806.1 ATP-binding cassette protein subfamily A member 10 putativeABC transporter putative (ABCA10) [Leptomo|eukprot:XP_015658797.1 ATP-binding cassette protein subfamily A member 10 putativeABC transporter putative (ABCA10) [Leptomonas pyrrhocoris]
MSFLRQYFIQLYGFLVKTFLQRWRTPVSTVVEILLPCLFVILMSIAYWRCESTIVPATTYDGGAASPALNMTEFLTYFACKKMSSKLKVPWYPCSPTLNATTGVCMSLIGNGEEVCFPMASYGKMSGIIYAMYFGSGPLALNSMDGHLTLAAMVTQIARQDNPTYFGRSGRASLSHYGKLLVSSDSDAVAQRFMKFCREKSAMCGEVLHSTPFTSLDAAQDYAAANQNTVWGIVDIPSASLTTTGETDFTISMNFTATANTAKGQVKSLFSRGLVTDGSAGYVLYWTSGFMTLQTFVHEFYMQEALSKFAVVGPAAYASDAASGVEGISKYLTPYGSEVIPMPTSAHFDNAFLTRWAYYMPLLAMMAALYPTSRLVMLIVSEKHNGIREAMLIMGLNPSCLFFGWYASTLIIDIIASLLAAMFLKVGFFSRVDYGLLVLLYFSFMQQNTALCFLVSSIFKNPRVASWFIAFVLFVCAIPSYSFPVGMTDIQKIFCCLIPCVGYAEVFTMMLNYVSAGVHYGWPQARVGYFDYSMAIGMMWASFGILMLLGFYLDRVSFGAVGRRAHPLFFLMPLWNMFHKPKAPLIKMSDMGTPLVRGSLVTPETPEGSEAYGESANTSALKKSKKEEEDTHRLIEHYNDVVDPLDPSIAAVFHRLRKIYIGGGIVGFFYTYFTGLFRNGDRVVALDGVTFAMRTGEVSVLLGPNGAGKTTIMGMAIGMVSPTNGDVYVRGYDAREHLDECRQNIGYCPQNDIVWSHLTVEEHITFYARMKGAESIDVRDKVAHVMDLLELTEKRHCKASNLSGGQRRRLCVAVAMVGDSSVLFLDEPTAGMDIRGRKTVYDALNRSRAKRSVLISTHLLDEADRIADRVLIVNKGLLCAEGSTMYLKSQMEVGYVVTCLLEGGMTTSDENRAAAALVDFVRAESYTAQRGQTGREDGCVVLGAERRGREVSFRFPMTLLGSAGVGLLSLIQANSKRLGLRNVALNLTTLEDVFFTVTRTRPLMAAVAEGELVTGMAASSDSAVKSPLSPSSTENLYETNVGVAAVFCRHFRALFLKRCHYAQRDIKLLVYQVLLPVIFLLLSLLVNLVRDPNQPSLRLDMTMYPEYATNPSQVMTAYSDFSGQVRHIGRPLTVTNAFHLSADLPDSAWGSHYKTDYRSIASGQANATYDMSNFLMEDIDTHTSPRYIAIAPVGAVFQAGMPKILPTLMHNTTTSHAAPQALDALYRLARTQLFGASVPQHTVVNSPMKLGEFEKNMVATSKQVMMGIFIIIPFIFIPSNTIGYIVEEEESGARHMQWLSGMSVFAYWMSSFMFDVACYIGTQILTFVIFVIFNRTEFVSKDTVGPAIVMFLFYGVSSIPVSYFMSFFFKSAFSAQSVVFCINFTFGFLWVTVESMIAEQALLFAQVVTYILRIFPAVCFGESMYVLSGTEMANMMFPTRVKTSLFALLKINARGTPTGGIGTGLIYMSCVGVGCTIALIIVEYLRLQRLNAFFTQCCTSANEEDAAEHALLEQQDPTVLAEERRVCADETGPATDRIAVQHLHKRFMGEHHAAVEDISFGVREGEVLGLLGLNGAGKTTTVGILAGEVIATGGKAFVNHYAVQSLASRSYVGYCPQYDALLCNLSAEEHLWLYARLRGIREKYIEVEVPVLLRELGLSPFRTQAAGSLSGGNKRRLSLAIALVGHTTSVLLDEPTSGMDAVARAQTCEMVRRLTVDKSVVLTTHLLDEVEALADRVAFVVRGNLRCVGTPQELKAAYNTEASYTLSVLFPNTVRLQSEEKDLVEKVREYVLQTVSAMGTQSDAKREITCEVSEVHPCSMVLLVNGDLPAICAVVSQLQGGRAEGIPATTYVSVSQPTLEDILLLQ